MHDCFWMICPCIDHGRCHPHMTLSTQMKHKTTEDWILSSHSLLTPLLTHTLQRTLWCVHRSPFCCVYGEHTQRWATGIDKSKIMQEVHQISKNKPQDWYHVVLCSRADDTQSLVKSFKLQGIVRVVSHTVSMVSQRVLYTKEFGSPSIHSAPNLNPTIDIMIKPLNVTNLEPAKCIKGSQIPVGLIQKFCGSSNYWRLLENHWFIL